MKAPNVKVKTEFLGQCIRVLFFAGCGLVNVYVCCSLQGVGSSMYTCVVLCRVWARQCIRVLFFAGCGLVNVYVCCSLQGVGSSMYTCVVLCRMWTRQCIRLLFFTGCGLVNVRLLFFAGRGLINVYVCCSFQGVGSSMYMCVVLFRVWARQCIRVLFFAGCGLNVPSLVWVWPQRPFASLLMYVCCFLQGVGLVNVYVCCFLQGVGSTSLR